MIFPSVPVLVASCGLLLSVSQAAVIRKEDQTCRKTRVAILGAGVAGITAAQSLSNASISDFLIVDRNDYIGGRMRNTKFGKAPDGKPYTVELGANWVEGLQSKSGNVNPIWRLAQKHKIKSTFSDAESLLTYDETGAYDFMDLINDFDKKWDIAMEDADKIREDNLQDTSVRAGLSLAGWKPKKDMHAQAAEWWGWDFEMAILPEQSGFLYDMSVNKAVFEHFSDETNLVWDQRGFNTLIIGEANEFLKKKDPRLLLSTTVKTIKYSPSGVTVYMKDGDCIEAEYAICTFSVGVLQNEVVKFNPTLPRWKREAIEQFQMGTYTKIFMQFNETWWPRDTQYMLYADPTERGYYPIFQSLSATGFVPESNILFGTVTGTQAYQVEKQTEEETQAEIMEVLRSMFPNITVPEPTSLIYPRWSQEEWAFGSFSNWPPGMTLEKHQNLRANVNRLWFAGEANSAEFFGYLQGAWFEGKEMGDRIGNLINTDGAVADGEGELTRYDVLHGDTFKDEYDDANGWTIDIDD
ncbi:amine oxidase [Ilyonectria destructans]|nr:amine oxidase [Ilyonectria destructans]